MFWEKVMPEFLSIDLMVNKLKDLEDLYKSGKKEGGMEDRGDSDEDADPDDERSPALRAAAEEFLGSLKKVLVDVQKRVDAGTAGHEEKETASELLMKAAKKKKLFNEYDIDEIKALILRLENIGGKRGARDEGGRGAAGKRRRSTSRRGRGDDDSDEDDWGYSRQILTKSDAHRMEGWLDGSSQAQKIEEKWPHLPDRVLSVAIDYAIKEDAMANGGNLTKQISREEHLEYFKKVPQPMTLSDIKANPSLNSTPEALQGALKLIITNAVAFHGETSEIVHEARRQVSLFVDHLKHACLDCDMFLRKDGTTEVCFSDDEPFGGDSDSDEEHYEQPVVQRRRGPGTGSSGPRLIRCGECIACNAPDCRKVRSCKLRSGKLKNDALGALTCCTCTSTRNVSVVDSATASNALNATLLS